MASRYKATVYSTLMVGREMLELRHLLVFLMEPVVCLVCQVWEEQQPVEVVEPQQHQGELAAQVRQVCRAWEEWVEWEAEEAPAEWVLELAVCQTWT